MLPLVPEDGTEAVVGLMVTVQFCPTWLMVRTLLLIRTVPVRVAALTFAAMAKLNAESPVPTAALWKVIHGTLEVAVQLQPALVVISMLVVMPSAGALNVDWDKLTSHEAAVWETVNAAEPIVMLAVLAWADGLALAAQLTTALPVPV